MKTAGPVPLVLVLLTTTWVSPMPTTESTTRRHSQPHFGETIKQLTSQLMNVNASSDLTLDTRTPPKIKQHVKKPPKKDEQAVENSHPGIAVPIEEADMIMELTTKKFNFYKIENKPTTDQGLSTWVLLNSQTVSPSSSTAKTTRKPIVKQKPEQAKNLTAIDAEIFNKITKPLFKKRPIPTTTTRKPTTTATVRSTQPEKDFKLNKVKASVLTSAINNKNKTTATVSTKRPTETTTPTTSKKESDNLLETSTSSSLLSIESKDDDVELPTTTPPKKNRRPTTKRKKNKTRRRRPNLEKADTNTTKLMNKINNQKDKPISTQIYNYLSREIMPTVGVGLVGLVVTAGLASYFLYPFGIAKRSYEVDRKDKEGSYYYNDEYAPDGIAEEEVIGKVIAGMPTNNANNYQTRRLPSSRNAYPNTKYDYRKTEPQASADAIYLTPSRDYKDESSGYFPQRNKKPNFYNPRRTYNYEIMEHSQETGYMVDDKQFVVGNVPKEMQEATPAVVPEHGPRNLPEVTTKSFPETATEYFSNVSPEIFTRSRKRRSNDLDNEISNDIDADGDDVHRPTTTPEASTQAAQKAPSLLNTIRALLEVKIRYGLELLKNTSQAISRYFSEVQRRFNENMRSEEQQRIR